MQQNMGLSKDLKKAKDYGLAKGREERIKETENWKKKLK